MFAHKNWLSIRYLSEAPDFLGKPLSVVPYTFEVVGVPLLQEVAAND
jgi:hypothetical protein